MKNAGARSGRSGLQSVATQSRRLLELATADLSDREFGRQLFEALLTMSASRDFRLWIRVPGGWLRHSVRPGSPSIRIVATRRPPEGIDGWIIPVRSPAGPRLEGALVLRRRVPGSAPGKALRDLASILESVLEIRRGRRALRERVKEIGCLYALAEIFSDPTPDVGSILRAVATEVPRAWQYPEAAVCRIVYDGRTYAVRDGKPGHHRQSAPIVVDDRTEGRIEVGYATRKPPADEGPFLLEERKLLDSLAAYVSLELQRRRMAGAARTLEESLRQVDRLATLGQLASMMAHELNEPLGAILGFAELARKTPGVSPEVRRDLEKITSASLHARTVTRDLLGFVRPVPERSRSVDVREVVRNGLALLESKLAGSRVHVAFSSTAELPRIQVDPARLLQLVVNLLMNAIQAMPDGGRVAVRARSEEDRVVLSVRDTGVGMRKDVLRRIFTPFFTTKGPDQGTGLGLAIVKDIVEKAGGTIVVRSAVGRGTTFDVGFPVKKGNPDGL